VYKIPGAYIGEVYRLPYSDLVMKSSRLCLYLRMFILSFTIWILDSNAVGKLNISS
jgi:uncharacterized membrane protein